MTCRPVYGLRPPALDDLGLIGSLREQSARMALRPDVSQNERSKVMGYRHSYAYTGAR
jgi:hypothetical protein